MNKLQDNIETGINEEQSKINKSTDEYSSTSTYSTGDLVIYNNKLYKASQDITTAEEFNSGHWTETSITAELEGIEHNNKLLGEILDKKVSGLFRFINAGNLNNLKNTIGIVNAFALQSKSITNGPTNYDNGVQYLFIDITYKEVNNEIRCQFLAGHKKIWHRYTTTTNLGNWEQLV